MSKYHGLFWGAKPPHRRKPLRSLRELAAEFGLTPHQLAGYLCHSPESPKAVFHARGTVRNAWYDPVAVRAWWARRAP